MTAEQRLAEVQKFDRLNKLIQQIADVLVETNASAASEINASLGIVYESNFNWVAEQVPELKEVTKTESNKDAKETISPFQKIAIDKAKDKSQVTNNVANKLISAFVQGATIGAVFNAVRKSVEENLNSATTISTNAVTRTENIARTNAATLAGRYYPVKKEWVAVMDDRTRDAHAEANGQIVDIEKPFIVWGEKLQFPGDIVGSVQNTINCRCTTRFIFDKDTKK